MGRSRLRTTGPQRPVATTVPGATWQASVRDAAVVQTELHRLWARFGGERRPEPGEDPDRGRDTGATRPANVLVRANTFNLTAVARSAEDAARIEDVVRHLSELYPSRATILVADPDRPRAATPGLEVRAALLEQPGEKGRPAIRFECVTVEASAEDERHLASIASPLLVAELPDFLWWPSECLLGGRLFDDLIAITDRLIVDTAALADPGAGLSLLSELASRGHGGPKLSDFAWARMAPWRQVVTQFFDPPAVRASLDSLDEVAITYGAATEGGSGFSTALLAAGWLATRLGWETPGEVVEAGDGAGGWQVTLRAGVPGRRREIVLLLRPTTDPLAAGCLGAMILTARGAAAASFTVERGDPLGLTTTSVVFPAPTSTRMVYAPDPTEATLLSEDLRVYDRDPVFDEALAFAATLAPLPPQEQVA